MGVTGGLVRSIFFRNKSFGGRSNLGEKKRWSSVRSYLCGDEFNAVDDSGSVKDAPRTMSPQMSSDLITPFDSVLAIEDSASVKQHLEDEDSVSVKSSEVSVTQPLHEEKSKVVKENVETTETHIPKKLFLEEDAAVIIQSSFRSYLAKHRREETFVKEECFSGKVSIQVQTCNSVKAPLFRRKRVSVNRRTSQKNKTQVLRIKEDWDDSTGCSTVSKSRIQSRIEAMTKRERALAYAFSQQLRICSKKKPTDRSSEDETNIGWSWLERWMATRVPDSIQADVVVRKNRSFSIAGELESCASNDIPLLFEEETSISKRKSVPSYKLQATKRDLQQQTKKAKKAKTTPPSCKMGNECQVYK